MTNFISRLQVPKDELASGIATYGSAIGSAKKRAVVAKAGLKPFEWHCGMPELPACKAGCFHQCVSRHLRFINASGLSQIDQGAIVVLLLGGNLGRFFEFLRLCSVFIF